MWKPQGIYADFLLNQPVLFMGEGAIGGIATFPGARIAIICSNSLKSETKDYLKTVLKKKSVCFVDRSWQGEPCLEELKDSISALEIFKPDVIVAIGGGSIIDGAKLCRLFYEFPFFKFGETKLTQLKFKTSFIAIPTTVGSGAEASSAAVYVNTYSRRKEMIVGHDLQPSVVVLDPKLVEGAPQRVIISSSLDAMGHIIEGYMSNRDNSLSDINAEKALSLIVTEMSKGEPDFQRIQYAGYLGGIVQNHCIVGAAHAIAHQLTRYGYSHGDAVALLLPAVIRANCEEPVARKRFELLCTNSSVDEHVLFEFMDKKLTESGIISQKEEFVKLLIELVKEPEFVENTVNDMRGKGNPVPITKEFIEKIIRGLKDGF